MAMDLSHLHESVKNQALEDDGRRLRHVNTARWVSYPRAQSTLDRLQVLLDYPPCARMPCMLIFGTSGIGKTMVVEKFVRDHPSTFDVDAGVERDKIVSMQMPPAPDEKRFYAKLLESMGAPYSPAERLIVLEDVCLRLLRKMKPKMLIIDEVHHLLAGSAREQRRALNLLKFLANEIRIPVVALGTSDALHALQSDAQIASRFEPFALMRWRETEEFRSLLAALVRLLPLQKPSALEDRQAVQLLLERSGGITGRITWILQRAAEKAIRTSQESIDRALIDSVSATVDLSPSHAY